MVERRRHSRDRAFAAAAIGQRLRGTSTDCVVRDVSQGGALLLLDEPRNAPSELTLALEGRLRPARIVWRGEAGVGVAFSPPKATNVVSLAAERHARTGDARRLEDRIARFVRPSTTGKSLDRG